MILKINSLSNAQFWAKSWTRCKNWSRTWGRSFMWSRSYSFSWLTPMARTRSQAWSRDESKSL